MTSAQHPLRRPGSAVRGIGVGRRPLPKHWPPGQTPSPSLWAKRAIAMHEAGHATAFWALGYQLTYATRLYITYDPDGHWSGGFIHPVLSALGSDDPGEVRARVRDNIVVAFAGYEAEVGLFGRAGRPGGDLQRIHALVRQHEPFPPGKRRAGLLQLRAEAIRFVRRHWKSITQLADALENQGQLSGSEIESVLEQRPGL